MNSFDEISKAARAAGDAYLDALLDLGTATHKRKVNGGDMGKEWDAAMDKVLVAQEVWLREGGIDVSDTLAVSEFIASVSILREARTGKSLREEARERTWGR